MKNLFTSILRVEFTISDSDSEHEGHQHLAEELRPFVHALLARRHHDLAESVTIQGPASVQNHVEERT